MTSYGEAHAASCSAAGMPPVCEILKSFGEESNNHRNLSEVVACRKYV